MHKLRKATEMYRATSSEIGRVVIFAEDESVSGDAIRKVHICIPDGASTNMLIDVDPEDVTYSKDFAWCQVPSNRIIELHLLARQFVALMTSTGMSEVSIIVEYPG